MMMTALPTLTHDAQSDLDRYLTHVKQALRPHPTVDADEVEHDIRGHIEAELSDAPAPVTAERLGSVLERLGSPNQWVPSDDLPVWRRMWAQLSAGPEDWRLAYLTLALFVGGPLLGPFGPGLSLASILLARAGLALLDEKGEPAGARRWLFYPPLVVLYGGAVFVVFSLPIATMVGVVSDASVASDLAARFPTPFWLSYSLAAALVSGTWWMLLGLVLVRLRRAVRWAFWPFADWLDRRHGMRLAAGGFVLAALSGGAFAVVF